MALFQTGSGYRDATKALTIKALQERQKQAATAMATAQSAQDVNADPLSAVGHVANVLGGAFQQRRADSQESDARARLSQIMAGIDPEKGASMAQIAEMQQLDPDFATKEYERAMAERAKIADREDTQQFQTGERVAGEGFTTSERVAGDVQEEKAAKMLAGTQEAAAISANERSDQDKVDAAKVTAEQAELEAGLRGKTPAEIEQAVKDGRITPEIGQKLIDAAILEATPEQIVSVPAEVAAARGGDIAEHPEQYQYNSKTQEVTPVQRARSPSDIAAISKSEGSLVETRSTLQNLQKAMELAPNIFEGSGLMGAGGAKQRAAAVLKTPGAYDAATVKQAQDTQAYFNIMGEQAIMAMSNALTGATTEYEMQQFTKIMADEQTPLAVKQEQLTRMMAKVKAHEQRLAKQVEESGGDTGAGSELSTPPPAAAAEDAATRKKKYNLE